MLINTSMQHLTSGVTESLFYLQNKKNTLFIFFFGGGGRLGGLEDGIAMIFFPHDIYCAQSKVKWEAPP